MIANIKRVVIKGTIVILLLQVTKIIIAAGMVYKRYLLKKIEVNFCDIAQVINIGPKNQSRKKSVFSILFHHFLVNRVVKTANGAIS